MGWQRPSTVLKIKERIRARDGRCCVVCSMDKNNHKKRFGTDLEVHRIVPDSNYDLTWGVCVTLCEVCHLAIHGKGAWGWITRDDPNDEEN